MEGVLEGTQARGRQYSKRDIEDGSSWWPIRVEVGERDSTRPKVLVGTGIQLTSDTVLDSSSTSPPFYP